MSERRTWTVDELVEVMGVSRGSVCLLLKAGNYRKIGSIWLPHELSTEDMQKRVRACRQNLRWVVLPHPPYSPDLNPCDYDVFNKDNRLLRGKRFNTVDELKNATIESMDYLN